MEAIFLKVHMKAILLRKVRMKASLFLKVRIKASFIIVCICIQFCSKMSSRYTVLAEELDGKYETLDASMSELNKQVFCSKRFIKNYVD